MESELEDAEDCNDFETVWWACQRRSSRGEDEGMGAPPGRRSCTRHVSGRMDCVACRIFQFTAGLYNTGCPENDVTRLRATLLAGSHLLMKRRTLSWESDGRCHFWKVFIEGSATGGEAWIRECLYQELSHAGQVRHWSPPAEPSVSSATAP
jgi:hypothetical protein